MAHCPRCNRYFREPPDEIGDHPCPRCGFSPEHASRIWPDDYDYGNDDEYEDEDEEDDDEP